MKNEKRRDRRGAATVGLSLALLLAVTATIVTTMRGQWARREAMEANAARDVLIAAMDAVQSLPEETVAKGIRLAIDENKDHWLTISAIQMEDTTTMLRVTEQLGGKPGLSINRPLNKETK